MRNKALLIAIGLALLVGLLLPCYKPAEVMAAPDTYDWIGGKPAQTDTTNYDWVGGAPFIRVEYVAAEPEASVLPIEKDFGIVELNTASSTTIDYFIITNTGSVAVDIDIQGGDLTGGDDTWTLSDNATVGENIYGLKAGLDDADDLFDIVVMNSLYELINNLGVSDNQSWGLQLLMPSAVSGYDMQEMSDNITLAVSAH